MLKFLLSLTLNLVLQLRPYWMVPRKTEHIFFKELTVIQPNLF